MGRYTPDSTVWSHWSTASCTVDYTTTGMGTLTIRLRSIKFSLPSLYPLRHSYDNRPSTAFPYCKWRKAGRGLGTRLCTPCSIIFYVVGWNRRYLCNLGGSAVFIPQMSSSGENLVSELPECSTWTGTTNRSTVRGPGVQQWSCFGGGLKHEGRVDYHKM